MIFGLYLVMAQNLEILLSTILKTMESQEKILSLNAFQYKSEVFRATYN